MNLAQLEADLRAKKASAKALLENTMRACQEHVVVAATATTPAQTGRAMTAEEKAACDGAVGECRTLKARIDAMRGDANMLAELDRITDGMSAAAPRGTTTAATSPLSIGAQFASNESIRQFIANNGHRRAGAWTSPQIELVAATLDTTSGSGGPLIIPDTRPGFFPLLRKRLVIADLIAPGTTDGNVVQYMKEKTFTNAAAAVAQGGLKPESTLVFEAATSAVKKIAHWIPVTEEMLEDFAQTQSVIDERLRFGVDLTEEDELLNGTGVAEHLLGFMNLPGLAPAQPRGVDNTMDAIFKQITNLAVNAFVVADAIVMNPMNWQTVQLAKDANGNYLGSGPWSQAQTPVLWGYPVASTPSIILGTALVGAFRSAAQIFRKGGVRVEATNSHADFFVRNLVAIRAEERLALAVYREGAFGKVTGLN